MAKYFTVLQGLAIYNVHIIIFLRTELGLSEKKIQVLLKSQLLLVAMTEEQDA